MSSIDAEHYLLRAKLLRDKIRSFSDYPFSLDIVRKLDEIEFHPKVTYIVGENGSGKSTLLEAIAVAYGFNAEGGSKNFRFSTQSSHSELSDYIRLSKSFRKPRDGFFLRAESFYNVASHIDSLDSIEGSAELVRNSYGGKSLHCQSHGESFFSLFTQRFSGGGLYILDEPEAALSPSRQMTVLSVIHHLVSKGSQFVIATHSPILLAYPDSQIFEINDGELVASSYEDTECFQVTKSFINGYKNLLMKLFS